jgi:DNA replication and repair protein RecF
VRVDRFESANFRNLVAGPVEFGPALNVLVGENGQGKTNLLEAIYYFRFGRSFRAQSDAELIQFGQPFCRFEVAATFGDGASERFACGIERRGAGDQVTRSIKISGRPLTRRSDLAGRFPAILFGPHDLRIVSGEPENRRRFLDMVGTTTDPDYLRAASDYRRTLEQRNAALKARADRAEMAAWNERLAGPGAELTVRRIRLTARLDQLLAHEARSIGRPFEFSMQYETPLAEPDEVAEEKIREAFQSRLEGLAAEESRRGVTLAGPHRDDLGLGLNGNDLRKFGSQGQRRLFALLLKLAELAHVEEQGGEVCVLLLDDVFSEFDSTMMSRLDRVLDGKRQVFVTTPVELPARDSERTRTLRVEAGRMLLC